MKLGDRSQDRAEVDLARQSAPGAYRLESEDLTEADDVTAEGEFPEFGWFIKVHRLKQGEDGLEEAQEQFIECPIGLEGWLVQEELGTGDDFRILSVQKVDGEWQYECELLE